MPKPEPIPASHVYRWTLDPQGFRTLFGEPSVELLEAVAARRARQASRAPSHWARSPILPTDDDQ